MFIVDDILLSPIKGLIWVAEKINDMVERLTTDESYIRDQLMQLRLKFELDEIDIDEYEKKEKELLARLEAIEESERGLSP